MVKSAHFPPVATPLRELARLNAELGLGQTDLALALGVAPRTVERWLADQTYPQHEARKRLAELLHLFQHVRDTFTSVEGAREWLQTAQCYLGWLKPSEVLRAGRFDRVEGALEVLDSGIFI